MKIDPLNIVLDQGFKLNKKFYFISGNEKSFIEKIITKIIEKYRKDENISTSNIDSIDDYVDGVGLFEDKKIISINNCAKIDEENLNKLRNSSDIFIFSQENSAKIKKIKNIFLKDKDSYLLDCYELDKNSKIKIMNKFIQSSELNIKDDVYWFIIEKIDNKYGPLEDDLDKIFSLEQKDITLFNIKKLLTVDGSSKEKIFFSLHKKNKDIIELYREKILTISDVNEFYYYCKSFCQLIIDCKDEEDYKKKIPIYLFKEKNFLVDVYRKYNSKKKKMLLRLLFLTEKILRKENGLSLVSGLRFLLNVKKITIS
tara:strand:+ start:1133 stop:2071 length:939 start_codon:yes stop_codon:yes gene_type:complete